MNSHRAKIDPHFVFVTEIKLMNATNAMIGNFESVVVYQDCFVSAIFDRNKLQKKRILLLYKRVKRDRMPIVTKRKRSSRLKNRSLDRSSRRSRSKSKTRKSTRVSPKRSSRLKNRSLDRASRRSRSKSKTRKSTRVSGPVTSPFGEGIESQLQGAFTTRPKDELDTCRFFCEQSYKQGKYPPECGYRRLKDASTGRFYYDASPSYRDCLNPSEQEGFELESKCEIWNRLFTRQQLVEMLKPYVSDELKYLTKKQLCDMLSNKATEVYYELESLSSNWCQNLQTELATPEMVQVFALLQLPPPATFYNKKEACAELIKRVAEMKPPWYSRLWRYVTNKTKSLFSWVSNNPGKTLLLAAGLIAAIYFTPQIASAAQLKLAEATKGQLTTSDFWGTRYTNRATEAIGRLLPENQRPQTFELTWADTVDPFHVLRGTYNRLASNPSPPSPAPPSGPSLPSSEQDWLKSTYEYLQQRYNPRQAGSCPRRQHYQKTFSSSTRGVRHLPD